MQENAGKTRPFAWDKRREKAARLVADDKLTDAEIAAEIDIDDATLWRWKKHPEFAARVAALVAAYRETVRARGIAILEKRVDALNDRWKRMQRVIEARAEDLAAEVAGGDTGLLVRQIKVIGKGDSAREVEEYAVDTGLLREMREHEKQAAQELGQWSSEGEGVTIVVKSVEGVDIRRV